MIVIKGQVPIVSLNFVIANTSDESYSEGQTVLESGSVISLVLNGLELIGEVKSGATYDRKSMFRVTTSISSITNKVHTIFNIRLHKNSSMKSDTKGYLYMFPQTCWMV